jgi:hypothetical protein
MIKNIRRWWSAFTQPGTGGFIQPGDWRVVYPDGEHSKWISHGDARTKCDLHGGRLEWRGDSMSTKETIV